jgi:hypothetical protein
MIKLLINELPHVILFHYHAISHQPQSHFIISFRFTCGLTTELNLNFVLGGAHAGAESSEPAGAGEG